MARELPCEVGDTITHFSFPTEDGKTTMVITSDTVSKIVVHKDYFTIYTKKKFYPLKTSEYDFSPISEYPASFADYWIGEITLEDALRQHVEYQKKLGF